MDPLGLYVHIPFCVRKCHYCDFVAGPASAEIREQYVQAMLREIRTGAATRGAGRTVRTLFFGGGTPSELETGQLVRIVETLRDCFRFVETDPMLGECEWTIECNPGTVSSESLQAMRAMGFNRVSLGVQSFHDHHLRALGRIHSAAEALQAYTWCREAGFRRVNLDLIFCLPGQTLAEWQADVDQAIALQPEHLSLYNLTIEEATEFGRRHRAGLLSLPDEELSADMYEWVLARLPAAGFDRYEVSNFARPGEECRHNQIYWQCEPYLGFGVGAASYLEGTRWTHTGSMARYLETAGRPEGPERREEERLGGRAACGEAIMLGLRTREGADLPALGRRFGVDPQAEFGQALRDLAAEGLLVRENGRIRLTERGTMVANAVCRSFL